MRSAILYLALLLIAAGNATAQTGTFTISADRTTVGTGDRFEVSFTVSGSDVNGVKGFRPPNFNPFVVLSGPNQSTNMQIHERADGGFCDVHVLPVCPSDRQIFHRAGID